MKIMKSPGRRSLNPCSVNTPSIRRCGQNLWLNAASRSILGDPDYISVEYDEKEQRITLAASTDIDDYKVTRTSTGRSFSCTPLIKILRLGINERMILRAEGSKLILDAHTEGR